MISANVRPAAACSRNSTPSCASARAIAPIGSLPGRNCAMRHAVPAGHQALAQRRPQPAVDERGFAAARSADDGQKARVGQLVDHGIDLVLPAEEQCSSSSLKGRKPGKGLICELAVAALMGSLRLPSAACMDLAIAASAKPPNPSIRPGSSISIRSFLSLVLGSASKCTWPAAACRRDSPPSSSVHCRWCASMPRRRRRKTDTASQLARICWLALRTWEASPSKAGSATSNPSCLHNLRKGTLALRSFSSQMK